MSHLKNAKAKALILTEVLTLVSLIRSHYSTGKNLWDGHFTYQVRVKENESFYREVTTWLLKQVAESKQKDVLVVRGPSQGHYEDTPVGGDSAKVSTVPNLGTTVKFMAGDYPVVAYIGSDAPYGSNARAMGMVTFSCKTSAGKRAVVDMLNTIATVDSNKRKLWNSASWGWDSVELPVRQISSVILDEGQVKEVVEDIELFFTSEEKYARLGIPWHRGYIFHGPPGTGKTSFAKALATHLDMDIYVISLQAMNSDTNLTGLLSSVKPRSIVLIEDIDTSTSARERMEPSDSLSEVFKLSASGLYNALDGLSSPEGVVIIMSTNHLDKLDPAIMRPGRADRIVKLDYITEWQLNGIFRLAYSAEGDLKLTKQDVSPAQVIGIIKEHLDHPEIAKEKLKVLCNGDQ